jgi:hypothetical protein
LPQLGNLYIVAQHQGCGTSAVISIPCEEPMSETKGENFAGRAATYFVFVFLIAAILETVLANLAK